MCPHVRGVFIFNKMYFANARRSFSLYSSLAKKWMERHINDRFVKASRYKNYRARSAFKLIEIDDKYRLIKPGMIVIECGAAPGSWTQVIVERLKLKPPTTHKTGAVIAVDISTFTPVPGAICLSSTDFTSKINQSKILSALNGRKADLILSDMAPNVSGHAPYDHERIIEMVYSTLLFATIALKPGGSYLTKIFNGNRTETLIEHLQQNFNLVRRLKPEASRGDSTELYLLASEFKPVNQEMPLRFSGPVS